MAAVGNLNIQLTASIGNFVSNLDKAAQKMTSFSAGMAQSVAVGNLVSGAIQKIAASVVNLAKSGIDSVVESFKHLDDVGDVASRLGITTQSLLRLSFVARDAGVSQETLVAAMTKLQKNMYAAINGSEKQAAAFDRLKLNANELAALPIDRALLKVGDALNNVTNNNERAADAMDVLGKSGAELIGFLGQGSDDINKTADAIERFGGKISDLDSVNIDTANKNINTLWASIELLGYSLAATLAPYINTATVAILGFGTSLSSTNTAAVKLNTTLIVMMTILDTVKTTVELIGIVLSRVFVAVVRVAIGIVTPFIKLLNNLVEVADRITSNSGKSEWTKALGFDALLDEIKLTQDTLTLTAKDLDSQFADIGTNVVGINNPDFESFFDRAAEANRKILEDFSNSQVKAQRDILDKIKKEQDRAKKAMKDSTPVQRSSTILSDLGKKAKEIGKSVWKGGIQGLKDVFGTKKKVKVDIEKPKDIQLEKSSAVLKGSFEALTLQKQTNEEKMISIQQRQLDAINKLFDEIKNNGNKVANF